MGDVALVLNGAGGLTSGGRGVCALCMWGGCSQLEPRGVRSEGTPTGVHKVPVDTRGKFSGKKKSKGSSCQRYPSPKGTCRAFAQRPTQVQYSARRMHRPFHLSHLPPRMFCAAGSAGSAAEPSSVGGCMVHFWPGAAAEAEAGGGQVQYEHWTSVQYTVLCWQWRAPPGQGPRRGWRVRQAAIQATSGGSEKGSAAAEVHRRHLQVLNCNTRPAVIQTPAVRCVSAGPLSVCLLRTSALAVRTQLQRFACSLEGSRAVAAPGACIHDLTLTRGTDPVAFSRVYPAP